MANDLIHDRGRGPEIVGTRITVFPAMMKLVAAAVLALSAAIRAAAAQQEDKPAVDRYGDPLPPHAVARLGTLRFRGVNGVDQAAAVPGGKQLLGMGSAPPTVILWDAITGKEIRRFEGPRRRPARKEDGVAFHSVTFGSFAVSPDGKTLAAGTADASGLDCPLLLFDLATGRKLAEWPGHRYDGHSGYPLLAFVTPTLLVSAGYEGSVRIWNVATQRELRRLPLPSGSHVSTIVPSPNGEYIFVAAWRDKEESFWTAWEAATGKLVHREKVPGALVKLAVSPDGTSLALAMGMGFLPKEPGYTEMRLYSVSGWKERRRWQAHDGDDVGRCSIVFSPDGKTIATGGADGNVRRWDAATGKEIGPAIEPVQQYSQNVAYLDAATLITFGWQQTVKLWDAATGKPKRVFAGSELQVSALAYSPDGRHVAVGGGDAPIRVWDAAGGKQVAHLRDGMSGVTCLDFSPDGKWIVSVDYHGVARLWDWAKGGAPIEIFSDHKSPLQSVAFSPDGKSMAAGDQVGIVRVWAVSTGKLLHTLKGQAFEGRYSPVSALAFTADGLALFSSAFDHGVRHWDLTAGKEIRLIGPAALGSPKRTAYAVSGLAISPAGRWGVLLQL